MYVILYFLFRFWLTTRSKKLCRNPVTKMLASLHYFIMTIWGRLSLEDIDFQRKENIVYIDT